PAWALPARAVGGWSRRGSQRAIESGGRAGPRVRARGEDRAAGGAAGAHSPGDQPRLWAAARSKEPQGAREARGQAGPEPEPCAVTPGGCAGHRLAASPSIDAPARLASANRHAAALWRPARSVADVDRSA